MTAFSRYPTGAIETNIRTMYARLRSVSSKTITHADFVKLFVPPLQRELFERIAYLAETGDARRATHKWGNIDLKFTLNERPGALPPPIPRAMSLQADAPEELVNSITAWSQNGGDSSGDFGRVMKLFQTLNKELTRNQLRFVWPSIIPLCGANPDNETMCELAKDLQECRPPLASPGLPHGLLQACRRTAATISMASLIPADVSDPELGQVTIRCGEQGHYVEPNLEFYGLS